MTRRHLCTGGTHPSPGLTRPGEGLPSLPHKAKVTVRHPRCRSSVTPGSEEPGVTLLADTAGSSLWQVLGRSRPRTFTGGT